MKQLINQIKNLPGVKTVGEVSTPEINALVVTFEPDRIEHRDYLIVRTNSLDYYPWIFSHKEDTDGQFSFAKSIKEAKEEIDEIIDDLN